jgi:hypothetical protein
MILSIYGLYPSHLFIIHNSNCDNRAIPHLLSISIVAIRICLTIHPSIHPSLLMSSPNSSPLVLLFSLADNARTKLPDWYGDVCSQARNLCSQPECTGALTLVARTDTWNSYPAHVINTAQVAAGTHPPTYEARPTWDLPNAPAAIASRGVFSLYQDALARNHAYAAATSTLVQALLASIGPDNKVSLEATFDPDLLYTVLPYSTPNCGCYVRRTWHDQPARPGCVTGTAARTTTSLG